MIDARGFRALLVMCGLVLWPAAPSRAESAAVPYVLISDVTVIEGNTGTTSFSAEVRLSWPTAITVDVAAYTGTATTDDFTFATTRLTLVPGEVKTVSGFVIGDRTFEGDEAFDLRATIAPGDGGTFYTWLSSSGGQVTIRDDDGDAATRIKATNISVREGDSGPIKHEIKVSLQPASTTPITVDYATMDVSAQAGADYAPLTGSLTFAPGEIEKIVDVEVKGDLIWERDESLELVLSHPHGAVLDGDRAKIVITNDDPPIVISADDVTVSEGTGGTKTVPITFRWAGPGAPLKIHVEAIAGTARTVDDHNGSFTTLYPRPGDTSLVFPLLVVSDMLAECDEGIVLQYGGVDTGDDSPKTIKVLIQDDDAGPTGASCPDPFGPTPKAPDAVPTTPDAGAGDVAPAAGSTADAGATADVARVDVNAGSAAAPAPAMSQGGCTIGGPAPALTSGLSVAALLAALARRRRKPSSRPR
jgi:hypothetical protein